MSTTRAKTKLVRQWQLVELLRPNRRGLSVRQILDRYPGSRSSLYRDFDLLREAGVPIESRNVNGEVRYTLWGHDLPSLGPSALQLAALRLARRALSALEGTRATAELDKLLDGYARAGGSAGAISFPKARVVAPKWIKKLDAAVHAQRRVRILYRSVTARVPGWRTADPLGMRYAGGDLYFVAYDDKRQKVVPFKIDRISAVEVLAEKARRRDDVDLHALFATSAKIWRGEDVDVKVRLSPQVARFAREYPLVLHQAIEDEPDGGCVVRARVAGVVEAMRWVLRWGKEAEALAPAALREAVASEVMGAARRYGWRETSRMRKEAG